MNAGMSKQPCVATPRRPVLLMSVGRIRRRSRESGGVLADEYQRSYASTTYSGTTPSSFEPPRVEGIGEH